MRVELLLELSGLSRQEALVVKACTSNAKDFEAVCATLVEHCTGVHLKEGRALGGGNQFSRGATGFGRGGYQNRSHKGGRGKSFGKRAFPAAVIEEEYYPDEEYYEEEDHGVSPCALIPDTLRKL